MNTEDWDKAYRKKGEIQKKVSGIVESSLNILKHRSAKKVLDIGFGTGRHTIFLAENGFDVYGIDISEAGKEVTEKKTKEMRLENVHLKIADMHDIPFGDNYFDAIVAVHTIVHNTLSGLEKTISELYRVLKPGGILITNTVSTKDPRFNNGIKIEHNTYIIPYDPDESNVPHHFSDEKELKRLFSKFNLISLWETRGFSERRKMETIYLEMIAEKLTKS